MTAYYNEIDPYAAQWLRNLIAAGMIAPGDVDERSIEDVCPDDLRPYTQCHFFAGIGIWSGALRAIGWPDDRGIWSMSCPCQPFSAAGKGGGFADERHLWPAAFHLITQLRPERVVGEQVASPDGLAWIDLVQSDLEGADYAARAVDICAAGFGAPNIRQRLYWMADAGQPERTGRDGFATNDDRRGGPGLFEGGQPAPRGPTGGMADNNNTRLEGRGGPFRGGERPDGQATAHRTLGGLADATSIGRGSGFCDREPAGCGGPVASYGLATGGPGPVNGFWSAADWISCRDEKWRPVEPGTFPLANGRPNRMGILRAYGNALNFETAAGFLRGALG